MTKTKVTATAEPTAWLTRQEAADRLRVSPHTVDRWTRQGRLTKFKVADLQSVRFKAEQVDALVQPAQD